MKQGLAKKKMCISRCNSKNTDRMELGDLMLCKRI